MTKIRRKMIVEMTPTPPITCACGDCGSSALEVFTPKTSFLPYLVSSETHAVYALAKLTNERPIAEQRRERCHVVQSSLKRLFSLVLFLLAALKHKRFASHSPRLTDVCFSRSRPYRCRAEVRLRRQSIARKPQPQLPS